MAAIAATSMSVRRVVADDTIAGLVAHAAEKNAAFMRGDMERWSRLARIAPDFTLMQPFGGPASHGFDNSPKRLAELARTFRNGQTELEVAQAYAAENFAVLVMIERQVAEVGGLPSQDWSLRVTEVYRRTGSDWQLAHRHADPLVHRVTLNQAAALARGLPGSD
jgi:ketosteroid isomerase-like protein